MDFNLSENQNMIKDTISNFAKKELTKELVQEHDEEKKYPHELYQKIAELGFLGLPFPEKYSGFGGTVLDMVILLEELSKGMIVLAGSYVHTVVFGGMSLMEYGSEEQKMEYLPKIISGEKLFCLAITEPNAGSDISSITTTAVLDGDNYVINGAKTFITGAHVADYMVFGARTNKDVPQYKGITMFIVPTSLPGIEIRPLDKLGMRAIGTNEVFLEDVRVPKENVMGGVDQGWKNLMRTFNNERCACAAVCVGASQAAIDTVVQYVNERVQFGQPIGKFQVVQHDLVDMQMEVDNARLQSYRAAWLSHKGKSCSSETSMAKAYSAEVYRRVANQGMQLMGGYGYMMEYELQRHYRDCKFWEIAGGTSHIQRNIIAKEMGL